ncbi:MFS-type transporter SLC18B1 [Galendromus occidentalis]|uniref:MFS-type transporter SLC18B1 n=1 Tax=Galendromus occidentalis TaxID=34638 RepID=A0AAJ7WI24_9ACAR|nr:MFS-type transporter SLC18B1 [Galendromus occidentalis]
MAELNKMDMTQDLKKPGALGIVWTTRRKIILSVLIIGTMLESSCYALMAPFFPDEAKSKGNSATQFGIVFGTYPLVGFVFSPICGKLLSTRIKPKTMLICGMLVDGFFLCLMGTLKHVNDSKLFFALGVLIRFFEAIGFSASITCYYAIASSEFSERVHFFVPLIETIFGVGIMVGPTLGGALYDLGGYTVPFLTFGIATIVFAAFTFVFLPQLKSQDEAPGKGLKDLYVTQIILDYFMVVVCFIIIGFNEATLSIHLKQFGLSESAKGACFIIPGGIYAISSISWGAFCRRVADSRYFVLLGGSVALVALLICGPVPWLNFKIQLWIILLSQGLMGFGDGAMYVCSFMHSLAFLTQRKGFEDDFSTYALLAGIFSSAFSLGGFLGPIIGGVLLDLEGYEYSTGWIACILSVGLFFVVLSVARDHVSGIDLRDEQFKTRAEASLDAKPDVERGSRDDQDNGQTPQPLALRDVGHDNPAMEMTHL